VLTDPAPAIVHAWIEAFSLAEIDTVAAVTLLAPLTSAVTLSVIWLAATESPIATALGGPRASTNATPPACVLTWTPSVAVTVKPLFATTLPPVIVA
jgi:hypothetical protein